MWVWEAFIIFLVNAMLDIVWARYTITIGQRRAIASANWAVAIILIGGVSILIYTHDPFLLFPAAAGAWVGTWITVERAIEEGT